jgi:hypothetical protein
VSDNVTIKVFEHGELVDVRTGHNVWLDKGRYYLAELVSYASYDPDVLAEDRRVRYMGVGIGSKQQTLQGIATSVPISTAYPVPVAPNSTTGFDFWKEYPFSPTITTLERPVRVSGSVNPVPQPADVWLVDEPSLFFTHLTPHELTVHAVIDGSSGDVVYSTLSQMPLSEAGLFLSDADVNTELNQVVAYHSFATILLNVNVRLEFIWSVRF